MLSLYLVERELKYRDEVIGFVVASTTHRKARKIASKNATSEGSSVWLVSSMSSCKKIGEATKSTKEGVVLESFIPG